MKLILKCNLKQLDYGKDNVEKTIYLQNKINIYSF